MYGEKRCQKGQPSKHTPHCGNIPRDHVAQPEHDEWTENDFKIIADGVGETESAALQSREDRQDEKQKPEPDPARPGPGMSSRFPKVAGKEQYQRHEQRNLVHGQAEVGVNQYVNSDDQHHKKFVEPEQ